jgi:hypothetical protein
VKVGMVDEDEGDNPGDKPDEGDDAEKGAEHLGGLQVGAEDADAGAGDQQEPAGEEHKDKHRKEEEEEDAKEEEEAEKGGGNQAEQQPTVMEDKCKKEAECKGTEQCNHAGTWEDEKIVAHNASFGDLKRWFRTPEPYVNPHGGGKRTIRVLSLKKKAKY